MPLLVSNVPWTDEPLDDARRVAVHLGLSPPEILSVQLLKRSVDGRRRPPLWLANYRVELRDGEPAEQRLLQQGRHGLRLFTARDAQRFASSVPVPDLRSTWPASQRPIVIGAGPAGLFAALRLGEAGAPALLLERGEPVERRHYDVRAFWRHGQLDPESNAVFGEGGAGAFSDGKIYTRRRDGELGWVFRRLVDHGADPRVMEEGWAHLGTDRIREILPRLRARLAELGVEVRFRARVDRFVVEHGRCVGVELAGGELLRGAPVIVATGHSARDTWQAMLDAGASAEQRPIHIGARVEHPQRLVDQARYGAERGALPPASYRFTSVPPAGRARPAHTFCMCPGGTIVAASNHAGRVVVNGMSYSNRRAAFANSAVVVEVLPSDYGAADPLAGARFQDHIERLAFDSGGGGFRAPGQLVEDLLAGRPSQGLPKVSYTLGAQPTDLREILPGPIIEGMREALRHFERQLPGFAGPEAVLIAPETRTSAPVRFTRGPDLHSLGLPGLMPVGEGAGFAGGIVSAALDGMKAADAVIATVGAG